MAGVTYGNVVPKVKRVFFEGTTALGEGYGLCYNYDYGTAASVDAGRAVRVEKPSTTNALYFAGVAARSYVANASGQWIDIIEPGSYCNVYGYIDATLGTSYTSFCQGQHYFYTQGFKGRGRFHCLQTIARGTTAGLIFGYLEDGEESGGVELFDATTLAAGGAITPSLYGVTYFPAATLAANATKTLADGTFFGQKKGYVLEGTMTTNDIVVTVTTPQIIAAVATSGYDVCTMDAAAECLFATWNGKAWELQGAVLA